MSVDVENFSFEDIWKPCYMEFLLVSSSRALFKVSCVRIPSHRARRKLLNVAQNSTSGSRNGNTTHSCFPNLHFASKYESILKDLFVWHTLQLIQFKCLVTCPSLVLLNSFIDVRCSIGRFRGDGVAMLPDLGEKYYGFSHRSNHSSSWKDLRKGQRCTSTYSYISSYLLLLYRASMDQLWINRKRNYFTTSSLSATYLYNQALSSSRWHPFLDVTF